MSFQVIRGGKCDEPQGLSNEARRDELKAQAILLPAYAALRSAIQDALLLSTVMRAELLDLQAALEDSSITEQQWDEAMDRAHDETITINHGVMW
jgi:hypothetical protein